MHSMVIHVVGRSCSVKSIDTVLRVISPALSVSMSSVVGKQLYKCLTNLPNSCVFGKLRSECEREFCGRACDR